MSEREELFRKFGPLLIESLTMVLTDLINKYGVPPGLSKLTYDEAYELILNHLSHLDLYDWMKEEV